MTQRIIRFRAWDKADKRMLDPFTIEQICQGGWYDHPDWELMQFTGLLDKNGKEIYEGDVVKNDRGNYTVEYRDYCFCLKEIENSVWLGATHEFFEVIGNVFSNPNLLS